MDYGNGDGYTIWEQKLANKGYYRVRQYYPFGRHSTFQNSNGRVLIRYDGKWNSWEQVARDLRVNWCPVKESDILWAEQNLGVEK